jgi:hypothetical protein
MWVCCAAKPICTQRAKASATPLIDDGGLGSVYALYFTLCIDADCLKLTKPHTRENSRRQFVWFFRSSDRQVIGVSKN